MIRIGIDLGGTKIAGVALGDADITLAEDRVATPRDDYTGTIEAISSMVDRLLQTAGHNTYSIGIGIPGSMSPLTGKIQNSNSTWLNGKPFIEDLEAQFGQPVRLANDANCLALSEAMDGAGKDAETIFCVIFGTGCGGALVANKKLVQGRHNISGEWGHNPLPWAKEDEMSHQCWCGRYGCHETWLSGPAIARDHYQITGQKISPEEIVSLANNGDRQAQATLDRHLDRCARGLASVCNIVDPDMFIIAGGLCDLPGLIERLPGAMSSYAFADALDIKVVRAQHGAASGVRGAARLWPLETASGV